MKNYDRTEKKYIIKYQTGEQRGASGQNVLNAYLPIPGVGSERFDYGGSHLIHFLQLRRFLRSLDGSAIEV